MLAGRRLDIHQIQTANLGIFRESFDRVAELPSLNLRPVEESICIWEFDCPQTGERGRLMDVDGFLSNGRVSLSVAGMAYLITRQGFTLALLFPAHPRRVRLTETNYKILPNEDRNAMPPHLPRDLISQVIRHRFRKILIVDQTYLLSKIGLRARATAQ